MVQTKFPKMTYLAMLKNPSKISRSGFRGRGWFAEI